MDEALSARLVFLSTPSVRRATYYSMLKRRRELISIHALRTEGDTKLGMVKHRPQISIHALRTEGDARAGKVHQIFSHFYPRPPYGGRHHRLSAMDSRDLFLSTPSVRRATNFLLVTHAIQAISIHALRTEGDDPRHEGARQGKPDFYPRPPYGGRHVGDGHRANDLDFYPRPPYGGRPMAAMWCSSATPFLSTPSVRRATAKVHKMLFAFAAQTRKFVVLILQNTHSLLLSKLFRALLHHFSTIFWCEGPSAFLCASCSHPLQQQHIIL